MGSRPYTLVPVLVGALSTKGEAEYGKLLAPYLEDPSNVFVLSSDFCHWGSRFQYQHVEQGCALHEGIEKLDRQVRFEILA